MAGVSRTIVVSTAYPAMLQKRYPWLAPDSFTVLPFGAPECDFELLPTLKIQQCLFNRADGLRHWVYVGRGGGDMAQGLRVLFNAIARARARDPVKWAKMRLHFAGTDYARAGHGQKTVEPIAGEFGLHDIVSEQTDRFAVFRDPPGAGRM